METCGSIVRSGALPCSLANMSRHIRCACTRYAALFTWLTALWVTLHPGLTLADSPASERPEASAPHGNYDQLLDRAVEAFGEEDFARARELFEQAYALKPNARVLRGLGIASLRLQRYVEAKRALSASLTNGAQPLTASQREEVSQLLTWMETNLGTLHLQWVEGAPRGHELLVDGAVQRGRPLLLGPGTHRLVVRSPGYETQVRSVEIVAGEAQTLTLAPRANKPAKSASNVSPKRAAATLVPSAATPTPGQAPLRDAESSTTIFERWWFWTAVGVIAAGGVTAAVLLATPQTKSFEPSSVGQVVRTLERAR